MAARTYEYSVVPDIFRQDRDDTDDKAFKVYDEKHFGLLLDSWAALREKVADLQRKAPQNVFYKVFYFARHGQGVHNVAEAENPGTWDGNLALKYGDEKSTWGPDPPLTDVGKAQAEDAGKAWGRERTHGLDKPQIFISSPLDRAADTLTITWKEHVDLGKEVRPVIVENWRETIGKHTCDEREPACVIEAKYPNFDLEEGFSMENFDEYWHKDIREKDPDIDSRAGKGLDDIFDKYEDKTYILVTAHCGIITAALRVLGHRKFYLETGTMIPVVVKAIRTEGPGPSSDLPTEGEPSTLPGGSKRHLLHISRPHVNMHHSMKKLRRQY